MEGYTGHICIQAGGRLWMSFIKIICSCDTLKRSACSFVFQSQFIPQKHMCCLAVSSKSLWSRFPKRYIFSLGPWLFLALYKKWSQAWKSQTGFLEPAEARFLLLSMFYESNLSTLMEIVLRLSTSKILRSLS